MQKTQSDLYTQRQIRFLLTANPDEQSHSRKFFKLHGESVSKISFAVENCLHTFEEVQERGATVIDPITTHEECKTFTIQGVGDIINEFVQRSPKVFRPGFEALENSTETTPLEVQLSRIDHLTNNVPYGEMEKWVDYYKKIFGFKQTRYFNIQGSKTGLHSKVVQLANNSIIIPVNEPKEENGKDQIQEFLDLNKGAGVQHIALMTPDSISSVGSLKKNGIQFLDIPHTYYKNIPEREKKFGFKIQEDLSVLEEKQLLVDGDQDGYLIQNFTQTYVGPLFYEVIQRKNHWGFGEGNFQALFNAIEREQMERGYLK